MSIVKKIIKALDSIDSFSELLLLLKGNIFSLSSLRTTKYLKIYHSDLKTIIDVGANIGQFALSSAYRYPEAKIYSFEPLPDTFGILEKNVKNKQQVTAFNYALGNFTGKIDFFKNEFSQISSSLKIDPSNNNPHYQDSETTVIQVDAFKLDDLYTSFEIISPVLLKLDVQGMEKKVLEGAVDFLKKVDFVLFEAPFETLYEGQPLFDELNQFMKEQNFSIEAPIGYNLGKEGKIIEMDLLYKKT